MRRSNKIFLLLLLGISCFFSAIYFLGRSLVFLTLISTYGTASEDMETYEVNLLLFGVSALFSSIFLALGFADYAERGKEE